MNVSFAGDAYSGFAGFRTIDLLNMHCYSNIIKYRSMSQPSVLIEQYLNESAVWKQIIGEIQDKNIILKSRLSAVVKFLDNRPAALFERMESFYDLLLREDEITGFLSDEIKLHIKLLEQASNLSHAAGWPEAEKRQIKLGSQVLKVKQDFIDLTTAFNSYAEEVLLC
jgi:hypothetical protein